MYTSNRVVFFILFTFGFFSTYTCEPCAAGFYDTTAPCSCENSPSTGWMTLSGYERALDLGSSCSHGWFAVDLTDNLYDGAQDGYYFHFAFDNFQGYTSWANGGVNGHTTIGNVYLPRTGEIITISVWKGAKAGSIGDVRGRRNSGAAAGDWLVGDTLWIQCENYASIDPVIALKTPVTDCEQDVAMASAYQIQHDGTTCFGWPNIALPASPGTSATTFVRCQCPTRPPATQDHTCEPCPADFFCPAGEEIHACPLHATTRVLPEGTNLARACGVGLDQPCSVIASSTNGNSVPGRMVDGNTDDLDVNANWHSNSKTKQWARIDLGEILQVSHLRVYNINRNDLNRGRLHQAYLRTSTTAYASWDDIHNNAHLCGQLTAASSGDECWEDCTVTCNTVGQYVYILQSSYLNPAEHFAVTELEVFGAEAGHTQLAQCQCAAGRHLHTISPDVGVCLLCAAGTYSNNNNLVYDFTPYNTLVDWKNYATSIGASAVFDDFCDGSCTHYSLHGIWQSGTGIGYIEYTLPSNFDYMTVTFGNTFIGVTATSDVVILEVDGVEMERCTDGETKTYSQTYTPGEVLKISEVWSMMQYNLIITLSKSTCEPCPAGTYKPDGIAECVVACADVLPNSVKADTGSTSCQCAAGYNLVDDWRMVSGTFYGSEVASPVFSPVVNLARKCGALLNEGCPTVGLNNEHSTTGPVSAAVDGDLETYFYSHYSGWRWWRVDLGQDYHVTDLVYYAVSTITPRTNDIYLRIGTSAQGALSGSALTSATLCGGEINGQTVASQKYTRSCPANSIARYVYVHGGVDRLYIGELEVHGHGGASPTSDLTMCPNTPAYPYGSSTHEFVFICYSGSSYKMEKKSLLNVSQSSSQDKYINMSPLSSMNSEIATNMWDGLGYDTIAVTESNGDPHSTSYKVKDILLASGCQPCAPGFTKITPGNESCTRACQDGEYKTEEGCLQCAPGTTNTDPEATACTPCLDGEHSFRGGASCFDKTTFLSDTGCDCA